MTNFIAKRWAKWSYIFNKLSESEMHTLSAKVAARNAELTKAKIAQMTKDADAQEARITEMAEMEEKGFWECENGHELTNLEPMTALDPLRTPPCPHCGKPAKYIKR